MHYVVGYNVYFTHLANMLFYGVNLWKYEMYIGWFKLSSNIDTGDEMHFCDTSESHI